MRTLKTLLPLALLVGMAALIAQTTNPGTFRAPTVYAVAKSAKAYWTAGTVNNGGHAVAVAAGSAATAASENDCTYPNFGACNILFANSSGTVAVTQTIGTAAAAGDTIMAFIETDGSGYPNSVVLPLQSGSTWTNAASTSSGSAVTTMNPSAAGTVSLGTASLPWQYLWLAGSSGTPASNNFKFIGAATGARNITLPDASITVSGAVAQTCGSTAACGATNISSTLKVVQGIGLLVSNTPSTFQVTGMSPAFTSASSYTCTAQDVTTIATNIGVLTAGYVSGSAVTFTGPNTNTDTFRYTCIGY